MPMHLSEAVKKSDFLLVEGPKRSGKLTFCLFCAARCHHHQKTIIFTPFPKELFEKKIKIIRSLKDPTLIRLLQHTSYLCTKPNFHELKAKYGIRYMIEDIRKAVGEYEANNIIIHRIDLFFDLNEKDLAEDFISALVALISRLDLKLSITLSSDDEQNHYLKEIFEDLADIDFFLDADHTLSIKHSLFPLHTTIYRFVLHNHTLELLSLQNSSIGQKDLLLISQNDPLIHLHRYLLETEDIHLAVARSFAQALERILQNPHLTIYDQSDQKELDLSLCSTITKEQLDTQGVIIAGRNYIRSDDKLAISSTGCVDLLPKNFFLREYISALQKALKSDFYLRRLKSLPPTPKLLSSTKELCEYIRILLDKRLFFTLVTLKKEATALQVSHHIRKGDVVVEDGERLYLLLLDIRKENIPFISHKFAPFGKLLQSQDALEAGQIVSRICG
jgi:CheY-like chemotaxis protein